MFTEGKVEECRATLKLKLAHLQDELIDPLCDLALAQLRAQGQEPIGHIGMMDVLQCRSVVAILKEHQP